MITQLDIDGVPTLFTRSGSKLRTGIAFRSGSASRVASPFRVDLAFRVGVADETLPRRGITHVLQHLLLQLSGVGRARHHRGRGARLGRAVPHPAERGALGRRPGVVEVLADMRAGRIDPPMCGP